MIKFQCTQCGKTLQAPDNTAGKHGRCPKCQTRNTIPSTADVATEGESASAATPSGLIFWADLAESEPDFKRLLRFYCPKCQTSLNTDGTAVGKTGQCGSCRATVRAPELTLREIAYEYTKPVNRAIAFEHDEQAKTIREVVSFFREAGYKRHADLIHRLFFEGQTKAIGILREAFPNDREMENKATDMEYYHPSQKHMDGSPMRDDECRAAHVGAINGVINRWASVFDARLW